MKRGSGKKRPSEIICEPRETAARQSDPDAILPLSNAHFLMKVFNTMTAIPLEAMIEGVKASLDRATAAAGGKPQPHAEVFS
jgi:hypothetical protein